MSVNKHTEQSKRIYIRVRTKEDIMTGKIRIEGIMGPVSLTILDDETDYRIETE